MDDTKTQACQWKYCESECSWDTQCDNKYQFMNDGPKENDYKFCPGCGKQVTLAGDEQPATVEPEELKALASATCYAATVIVHTPSGPVPACEEHADKIRDLMRFMGAHVNFTEASPGDECSNCRHEAKRHNESSSATSGGRSATNATKP